MSRQRFTLYQTQYHIHGTHDSFTLACFSFLALHICCCFCWCRVYNARMYANNSCRHHTHKVIVEEIMVLYVILGLTERWNERTVDDINIVIAYHCHQSSQSKVVLICARDSISVELPMKSTESYRFSLILPAYRVAVSMAKVTILCQI